MTLTSFASLSALLVTVACVPACAGKTIDVGSADGRAETPGGGLAVAAPPPVTIVLGSDVYQPQQCGAGGGGFVGGAGTTAWTGPDFQVSWSPPSCSWPADKPFLDIAVYFRGFLVSAGFPPGTYDLADPKLDDILVDLSVSSQAEVPVGETSPGAGYSSSAAPDEFASGPIVHAAGVSGTITVDRYQSVTRTTTDGVPDDEVVYDITLRDVVLPIRHDPTGHDSGFPATAKITFAHIVNAP